MSDFDWNDVLRTLDAQAATIDRARAALTEGIAIFGAGYYGGVALAWLRRQGAEVRCFVDNNPAKQGAETHGIRTVAPTDLKACGASMVLIAARHAVVPVLSQLSAMGVDAMPFDSFFVAQTIGRISHLRDTLLEDERSRVVLDGVLLSMLTGRKSFCTKVMEPNQYFALPQFLAASNEHFIDCGAYVGDTVEKFIWANNGAFQSIHAFEPGKPQFAALRKRMARLTDEWALPPGTVTCVPGGVGAVTREFTFVAPPNMLQSACFSDAAEGEKVLVHSLDDYLAGRSATFIKADVEGWEMDLVDGAMHTIQTFKPKLALSVYHEPEHLFTLAERVKQLVPEYRMALRHHASVLMETVLYCWVEE